MELTAFCLKEMKTRTTKEKTKKSFLKITNKLKGGKLNIVTGTCLKIFSNDATLNCTVVTTEKNVREHRTYYGPWKIWKNWEGCKIKRVSLFF